MSEAPNSNQTTGLGDTFSSQPAPQTNPFTQDLKGEFTSNFGTNNFGTDTNVSQIFKDGNFAGGDQKKKMMMIGGGALLVVLVLVLIFGSGLFDDPAPLEMPTSPDMTETADDPLAGEDDPLLGEEENLDEDPLAAGDDIDGLEDETIEDLAGDEMIDDPLAGDTVGDEATDTASAGTSSYGSAGSSSYAASGFSGGYSAGASSYSAPMAGGPITLSSPENGSSLAYDESQGAAVFSWSGGDGWIVFSRDASFSRIVMRVKARSGSYKFHHPWPGTWYWKMENSSGETEARSFTVNAPVRRNVVVSEPTEGGAVSGNGGTVSWQGDLNVAYYRVEVSAGDWANPQYKFASSGNSVQLQGVAPGQYQMRVGAFSEVSGRWEFTAPVNVSVQ